MVDHDYHIIQQRCLTMIVIWSNEDSCHLTYSKMVDPIQIFVMYHKQEVATWTTQMGIVWLNSTEIT